MSIDQENVLANVESSFRSKESFRVAVGKALNIINESITQIDGLSDVEYQLLGDDTGISVIPFLRVIIRQYGGATSTEDKELDGTTNYTVVGTVVPLTGGGGGGAAGFSTQILCDNQGGGTIVKFIRQFRYDGTTLTIVDSELDGTTPYAPSGTVEDCDCTLIPTSVIKSYATSTSTVVESRNSAIGIDEVIAPPAGAISMRVSAWGAGGGASALGGFPNNGGGNAGFAQGTFAPQSVTVRLGTGGLDKEQVSPFPGGGAGGPSINNAEGPSGGGYSGIFATAGLVPLVIAGGGGGSAGASAAGGGGGHGGGVTGTDGEPGGGGGGDNFGGGAGTQVAGGAGGTADPPQGGEEGSAGAFLQGGVGGSDALTGNGAGGGGGGGYYGGGGGTGSAIVEDDSGGGGGSGFVDAGATAPSNLQGTPGAPANFADPLFITYGVANTGYGAAHGTALRGGDGLIVLEYEIPSDTGKALLWESCDGTIREWRDCETGALVDQGDIVGENTTVIFEPRSEIPFVAVGAGFTPLMAAVSGIKYLEVFNNTDKNLIVSFDAGVTEHQLLGPAEGRTYELARDGVRQDAAVHVKHAGDPPTTGFVRGSRYR